MKYVLDSSVAFKWVLTEVDSDRADRIRDEFRNAVHELLAPEVLEVELAHALTRAERQSRIPKGEAAILWADAMTTAPRLEPCGPLLPTAIAISSFLRVGVYDCLYIALAEQEGCELITADDKLVRKLQAAFPFIVPLTSLP